MAKKIIKKKKIKFLNLFLVLLFLIGISFSVYFLLKLPIKTIVIKNTNYLEDDTILDLSGLKDYPEFILTSSSKVEKKLNKSPYINKSKMIKKYNFQVELVITENIPLFFDLNNNKYVFLSRDTVDSDPISENFRVPRLLNYVPDNKYNIFIKKMGDVDKDILSKISDIEYRPNDYDKDRFLLYMDDGNAVYLTLTKFKMINKYNNVIPQLDGHKGILYLDSGNHFKIMQ